ncbi:MFS transporter [Allorhizocola rhizosphaerae]|uniref:MFS transporter n=1 Tax=Allorhizocola rhizosphaerae TaxID=1872709 RepID=UPI003CCC78AB
MGTYFGTPSSAAPAEAKTVNASGAMPPGDPLCSLEEWRARGPDECISRLQEVPAARVQCLRAPNPSAPDSGFGGWFAVEPTWSVNGRVGRYTRYGYAGYDYTTYDIGCADTLMHPDHKLESTIANGEFMIATGIVAASNGLREKAWNPGDLWAWANPLVQGATQAIYTRVFSVFGVITIGVIGLYLLWRSRQAHMSAALTTVGWALLVLIAVTALAKWPVHSANIADNALVGTLGVVHDAIGPDTSQPGQPCNDPTPGACDDTRRPAVRAGDTAVESLLYRNWLRGTLGSADSQTALKYGPALHRAKSFSWKDMQSIRDDPAQRQGIIDAKKREWMKIAEQIRAEDPEAYEYLRGTKGMERVGAGFVAIIAAVAYASFDIVASLLVLLGFLVIRWAVIAAPALGTIGLLRPASAGIRRLVNAVLAAVFNVVIFGTGAAIYLFAVDLIMSTGSLPGWLQVTLVLLCGVVGWVLLRPYTRITQLSGRSSGSALLMARPTPAVTAAPVAVVAAGSVATGVPESRAEAEESAVVRRSEAQPAPDHGAEDATRVRREWSTADVPEGAPGYAVYRPASVPHQATPPTIGADEPSRTSQQEARTEARAETR